VISIKNRWLVHTKKMISLKSRVFNLVRNIACSIDIFGISIDIGIAKKYRYFSDIISISNKTSNSLESF
jgi:hypothetical protein